MSKVAATYRVHSHIRVVQFNQASHFILSLSSPLAVLYISFVPHRNGTIKEICMRVQIQLCGGWLLLMFLLHGNWLPHIECVQKQATVTTWAFVLIFYQMYFFELPPVSKPILKAKPSQAKLVLLKRIIHFWRLFKHVHLQSYLLTNSRNSVYKQYSLTPFSVQQLFGTCILYISSYFCHYCTTTV